MELLNATRNDPYAAIARTGDAPAVEGCELRNRDLSLWMDGEKTIAINAPTVTLRIRRAAKTLIQCVGRVGRREFAINQLKTICAIIRSSDPNTSLVVLQDDAIAMFRQPFALAERFEPAIRPLS